MLTHLVVMFPAGLTDLFFFKLAAVGLPVAVPFVTALLVMRWKMKRGRDDRQAARALRTVVALVAFHLGVLATLSWYWVKDESLNRTNAARYAALSSEIEVGMTKAEVIEIAGAPNSVNQGKDGEELWWWWGRHRWHRPLAYSVIRKSAYQGGPYLQICFDEAQRVASVGTSPAWR